jgi:diaminohydroxyphosphoribosylaminopyrimidine deaminase/5-amino-6-(5-phosphoribosylamino)uracil reductase
VVDAKASISVDSQLVQSASEIAVLIACSDQAESDRRIQLAEAGCEVFICPQPSPVERLKSLLDELGRRRMTNLLVEGGSQLLGSLFDADLIDECHAFVAPKIVGGASAPSPIAGSGREQIPPTASLDEPQIQIVHGDVYISGRVRRV